MTCYLVVMTFLTCGNDLVSCGNDLLTCGNDFLSCGNNLLSCGNKIKKCKENSSMSLPGLCNWKLITTIFSVINYGTVTYVWCYGESCTVFCKNESVRRSKIQYFCFKI